MTSTLATQSRCARSGFTLMESLLAASILSFAVAAICQAVVSGQVQTSEALRDIRAMALAEVLLEEALALPYDDPEGATAAGPDAGESSRGAFDNSDDFDGYAETAGSLVDAADEDYPTAYQEFTRSVVASYGTVNVAALGGTIDGLNVTVTVQDDRGQTWTVSRFVPDPEPGS